MSIIKGLGYLYNLKFLIDLAMVKKIVNILLISLDQLKYRLEIQFDSRNKVVYHQNLQYL